MTRLEMGFSPCPNDTFAFHAMLHGLVDTGGYRFSSHIHDVELLNSMAGEKKLHVTKLSFFGYLTLKQHYTLLGSGAALGFGCGPLVVGPSGEVNQKKARNAVPGRLTTANLLLHLWQPEVSNIIYTRFDNILPGIQNGEFDAGVIIHEGRFVFENYNCRKIIDLGQWWEEETHLPIPLGCMAIRNDMATEERKTNVETIISRSVRFAHEHPETSRSFVKSHAQEMEDAVINAHIRLYVNAFTEKMGPEGEKAIQTLEEMARCRNLL
jgi:1,4-dihydroxy-6-naphthoate synthase